MELIYRMSGLLPRNVFDTQIGAGFAGFGHQAGYSKLLTQLLGLSISKTECYTDWLSRPLSESQLEYAIEDVCHLLPMFDRLCEELGKLGRLEWAQEECKRYEAIELYQKDRCRGFLRVKGSNTLTKRGLAVLESLYQWRDEEARRINKPMRTVLSDNILLELSRKPPIKIADIERIRGMRKDQLKAYGTPLLRAIEAGLSTPEDSCPSWPQSRLPAKDEILLADIMFAVVKLIAYKVDLATELIATRDEIQWFVRIAKEAKLGSTDHPLAHGWRWELAGKELNKLMTGHNLEINFNIENRQPIEMVIQEKKSN